MELIDYIQTKIKLTTEERETIESAFAREHFAKGTVLAQPGNRSLKIHFIESGLIRTFYHKDEKEITHFFFDANHFIASLESVYFNNPDPYGREVIEDVSLRTIHFNEFNALFNEIAAVKGLAFFVVVDLLKQFSDKLYSLQFQTAEQRYKFMMDHFPDILLRAPLGNIASYLGITQQTLSVIRAKHN